MIGHIRADLGEEIAQAVQTKLYETQAYMGQRSVYAQGHNRAPSRDYGSMF